MPTRMVHVRRASDVVARTRELKKRHRNPLVMPDDQRKGTYRQKRRLRGGEEKEEKGSNENVHKAGWSDLSKYFHSISLNTCQYVL